MVEADELLLAIGRSPRLEDLGLGSVGLTPDDVVAGRLPDWLHAVGDASGGPPLTHWGKHRARVVGARIAAAAAGDVAWEPDREAPVPQVVFSDPEVATVGMTEAEARAAGHDVVTTRVPTSSAAGTGLLRDHVVGDSQLVVDAGTHLLLGATFVGPEVGELVHAATVAIVGGVPVHALRHAVASYPTAAELWLRLLEELPASFRTPPR
jgi:dihydrolipoamide dehydrogenase